MKYNKTTAWAVVAVVVFAGAWYLSSGNAGMHEIVSPVATTTSAISSSTSPAVKKSAPKNIAPKPTATTAKLVGVGSTSYLMGLKQALVCTVKTVSGYARSGTMYIADGKARANFTTTSMIDDGEYLYAWTNGAAQGTKLLAALSVSGSVISSNGGVDLVANLSFACNPWVIDASFFVPPASVSF